MDFSLSEEQERYREELVRFAAAELNDDLIRRDAEEAFNRDAWKKCAAVGIQGLPVPEEFGGGDADALTVMVAMEALGYGCRDNGLLFSLNAHMWSCEMPLVQFGTEEQKRRYLPGLCDGSLIGVQAMTEPGSGSDAFALSTTAAPRGEGFVLNGTKTFITNAPVADLFVVFATTDRSKGLAGICAFLVDAETPGVSTGPPIHKMGLRTSPMSEVVFDGAAVEGSSMLGPPGAGMTLFNSSMEWERSCILASAVGTMQRQVERCIAYARERQQFGKPIGKFQSIANRIVDMKVRVETARLLLYRLGWLKGRGRKAAMDAALVKLHISESFVQSSLDAIQIHGGYGYTTELEIERELRDAIGSRIYSGTSEIQRTIVAGHLGL
jgi:alkylation response protein AidB-like acyl-CoA dehydrogenase